MSPREFEILARSLAPRLRSEALRIVSDGMDADDIVQDTMLKLWDMRERLDNIEGSLSPEELYIERQRGETADAIMAQLPDSQQTLLRLRHIEGYDNASIATLLGTTEGAVRTALSRARRHVAQIFQQQYTL